MSVELKIKSKHLSQEARIIRFEEYKLLKQFHWAKKKHYDSGSNDEYCYFDDYSWCKWYSLSKHRKWDVRNENRATFLARAYIAGIPYNQVEQKRKEENEYIFKTHILPRVTSMVAKYGKTKIQKEIWEGQFPGRKKVRNPAFSNLEKEITEWSKL